MFKYKKIILNICTVIFLLLSFVEFIKYMFVDSNKFGLIYLLINLLLILLLVPTSYNYKKYFSKIRISKLIIIVLLGIFNSFFLQKVLLNNMNVVDESKKYIDSIFVYKSIFKLIIYIIIAVITVFEFKVEKLFKTVVNKDK